MPSISYLQCHSGNYTAGRGGCAIDHIVIHYTGTAASARNNAKYFASRSGIGASAHYFVDGSGTIWQSVADGDRAWHAGDWNTNCHSIGIETVSDGADFTEAELAELSWLTQRLMAKYGIKAENVIRHYDVTRKLCPAPYVDAAKWAALRARITGGSTATATTTAKATQTAQKAVSGPNLLVDGVFGALTCKALQTALKDHGYDPAGIDGKWGSYSKKACQRYLKSLKEYTGYIDGQFGPMSVKALQSHCYSRGFTDSIVDGSWGTLTTKALQRCLNAQKF